MRPSCQAQILWVNVDKHCNSRETSVVLRAFLGYKIYVTHLTGVGAARGKSAGDPPATLGSYTLLTKLASGGMATVYVGNKYGVAGFERLVAIKCCHPHLRDDDEFVGMFLDEAKLAARIHHPNVVATLDVGCTDVLYLVMEYVEGDSLVALLRRAKRQGVLLPSPVAVRIMIDALTGLHAAHELCGPDGKLLNVVHRDVSPQNIVVGADGASRITDFGIAFAAARSTVTQAGRVKGKFSYMAPEQVRGQATTRRIDVYAAGIVLWEALTCRPLFRRKDDVATINAVLAAKVPPPSSLATKIPRDLDAIVLKALKANPDERYQSAAEFADALERLPILRATTREVASYVESALGPVLVERRTVIRDASEQAQQTFASDSESAVHVKQIRVTESEPMSSSIPPEDLDVDLEDQVGIETPIVPLTTAAGVRSDIEHWRMRALLAALMLLLVGSALGLLMSRMSASPAPGPNPAAVETPGEKRR